MPTVFSSPAEVTPDYLTRALRDNGLLPSGEVSAIKIEKHFRAVSTLATLNLSYTANSPSTAPTRDLSATHDSHQPSTAAAIGIKAER